MLLSSDPYNLSYHENAAPLQGSQLGFNQMYKSQSNQFQVREQQVSNNCDICIIVVNIACKM